MPLVTTSGSGTRTVEWITSSGTNSRSYDIHIERPSGTIVQSDDVNVRVSTGAVTVATPGSGSAYIGEQIDLTGTNTETSNTYFFITGPNLPVAGGRLDNPRVPVINGDTTSFTQTPVQSDNTWDYKWDTSAISIDAGTYTIFAESAPNSRDFLGNSEYSTVSITLAQPLISGNQGSNVVAQGDPIDIRGIATGNPSSGVAIWIFGKNYFTYTTTDVNSDSTFDYQVTRGVTQNLVDWPVYCNCSASGDQRGL